MGEEALTRVATRADEVSLKKRLLVQRAEEVASAEILDAKLEQAVEAARAWLLEFVASLRIPAKQKALDAATKEEKKRRHAEEKAAAYQDWQKRRLNTHQKFMALVNRQ